MKFASSSNRSIEVLLRTVRVAKFNCAGCDYLYPRILIANVELKVKLEKQQANSLESSAPQE
jgi:hypothetical protein